MPCAKKIAYNHCLDAIVRSECLALVEALLKHVSVLDDLKFELFWALLQLQAATPPELDLLQKVPDHGHHRDICQDHHHDISQDHHLVPAADLGHDPMWRDLV